MIPLVETFDGGERFEALFSQWADQPHTMRLQGGWDERGMGRYTILGFDPYRVIASYGDRVHRISEDNEEWAVSDPFQALEHEYQHLKNVPVDPRFSLPFQGGAIGYLGYELRRWVEPGLSYKSGDIDMPDMYFAFFDVVCVYDNLQDKGYIFSTGLPAAGNEASIRARQRLDSVKRTLNATGRPGSKSQAASSVSDPSKSIFQSANSSFDQKGYIAAVNQAKRYIASGEIFQVNLSQRFKVPAPCPSSTLFELLRQANPSPFGAYLHGPGWSVISVSPERFFRFDGKYVETRPIKGTRSRGSSPKEDEAQRKELVQSEKDQAEHVMIVDLARSDLGRFCAYHSIDVTELMVCEGHPTVWHLVSTVKGILRPDLSPLEAVRASFPGSSITGTPKARSMAIIDELEPVARGIYTGSIGYLGIGGAIDLNVAIRTVCHVDDTAYFHVGGAIVADSDPVEEYEETLAKGLGIARGIAAAGQWGSH